MIVWMSVTAQNLPGEGSGLYATHNRFCLFGLDSAANTIRGIRCSTRMPATYWATTGSGYPAEKEAALHGVGFDWRFYDGVRSDGEQNLVWTGYEAIENNENPLRTFYAATDGRIYCAMNRVNMSRTSVPKEGVTQAQLQPAFDAYRVNPSTENYNALFALLENDYRNFYTEFFRVYRESGDQVAFPAVHDRPISAVYADDTALYIAGDPNDADIFLKKLDLDGTLIWEAEYDSLAAPPYYVPPGLYGVPAYYNDTEWQFYLHVSSSDDVYVTGRMQINAYYSGYGLQYSYTLFFRKYNSSGVLQWERRLTMTAKGATIDQTPATVTNIVSDGTYYYLAHGHCYQYTDEADDDFWIDSVNENPASVTVWDEDGDLAGFITTPYTIGSFGIINAGHHPISRLALRDGMLFLSMPYYSSGDPVAYIYDTATLSSQTLNLTEDQYIQGRPFAFDSAGYQYFAAVVSGSWYAFDDAGVQIWTDPLSLPTSLYTYDLQIVENPELPALALPLNLGRPDWQGDRYTSVAGLALGLSLAIPRLIRDYVGALRPAIHRLVLYGSPPLELPVISASIRRNALERSLSVVIAPPSLTMLDAIEVRDGNDLIFYRGVRFADDAEQLDILALAPLTGIRVDRGGRSLRLSLEGKASEATAEGASRTIQGISYRSLSEGRRRVRCAVDTYLRPGDVANLGGGESLVVAEIVISLTVNSATMEIAE
jgi:hypothetical protein